MDSRYWVGFGSGVLATILGAVWTGATPLAMRDNIRQSALKAGVGHWSLDTNVGWTPIARFEWTSPAHTTTTNVLAVTAGSTNKP